MINDGEVTALAAVAKLHNDPTFKGTAGKILGISMGSSEGGGYANKNGNLPGWINEMCYYKLDLNPDVSAVTWNSPCPCASHSTPSYTRSPQTPHPSLPFPAALHHSLRSDTCKTTTCRVATCV